MKAKRRWDKISNMGTGRNRAIDGMKGIGCVLIAFMWHYRHFGVAMQWRMERILPLRLCFSYGWLAVEVFFILSGYVIEANYKDRIKQMSLKDFMIKRIKALWPLMTITLIAVTVMQLIYYFYCGKAFIYSELDVRHFLLNLFMIHLEKNASFNGPSWYVSALMPQYLFYYFIARIRTMGDVLWKIAVMVMAVAGYLLYMRWYTLYLPIFRGMWMFFVGVLLSEAVRKGYGKKLCLVLSVMGGVLLIAVKYLLEDGWMLEHIQEVFALLIAPLLVLWVCLFRLPQRLFAWRPLVWMGKYSYGIYLWHFPVQLFIVLVCQTKGIELNYGSSKVWIMYCLVTTCWTIIFDRFIKSIMRRVMSEASYEGKQSLI